MTLLGQRKRREKLGDPLHAALRLELFDLLDEMMHVLRDRCDHRQCDVGTFTDATDNMIGRNACDARFAYSFGGSHVSIAGECDRLRETLALCHNFDHGFIAGRSTAIKFYPTVDHDKKRSRRIVLAHDPFVRPQHEGGRRRDDVLDGLRFESSKNRDAGNDLKIASRQFRSHAPSLKSDQPHSRCRSAWRPLSPSRVTGAWMFIYVAAHNRYSIGAQIKGIWAIGPVSPHRPLGSRNKMSLRKSKTRLIPSPRHVGLRAAPAAGLAAGHQISHRRSGTRPKGR